jgi:topoisomerase-4 subunit A
VIGKYHPHGDTSVYDAMVRVAQDFSLRYPLVDGQGNFGSRDGDSAAAMRYTECRLTPIAGLLLSEIDRGTVDFIPNYDGAFHEPQLLPARLPFVLMNGASGIAVGMATEIPPHNLNEVAEATCHLIRNPAAGLDEILPLLPGPDFPGGGQLISAPEAIRDAYTTGRGSLRLRARWRVEELARGQWRVIVEELPHGVSAAQVLGEIETLTNPQPRTGKKDVSQEQKNLKQLVLGALETVRDESSDKAPVRIVLEPRSSRQGRDEFMAVLLAHTSLETSASVNLTMIGHDGRPQQKEARTDARRIVPHARPSEDIVLRLRILGAVGGKDIHTRDQVGAVELRRGPKAFAVNTEGRKEVLRGEVGGKGEGESEGSG